VPGRAQIPAALLQQVIDAARDALPDEVTGLLVADEALGEGGAPSLFVPLTNADGSPYRFHAEPEEQLRQVLTLEESRAVIWGIVHSHVDSPALPSPTDARLAADYPDSLHLICSLATEMPEVRAWSIRDGQPAEVPLSIN